MIKSYKILFLSTLISGTLIAISSYSWLSMWMGLEINLLSMIPLLSDSYNIYPSESAVKYFITQVLASTLLLFSIIMAMNMKDFLPQNPNYWLMMILNSALLTKLGAAPFHIWFPEVIDGLNWGNCLIMLTWQKIAPMVLLMFNFKMTLFLSLIIIFSTTVGSILGINQISLRKIMAYSSINHIAWMIASMVKSDSIWLIYFLIYSLISINIILILSKLRIFYLPQLLNSINSNKNFKFFFIMNFLSLGGLPPFLGFYPKWLTVNSLVHNNFFMVSLILIVFTLVTLFFYLRITFSTLMINSNEVLINQNPEKLSNFFINSANFISLSGIIACTLVFNVF